MVANMYSNALNTRVVWCLYTVGQPKESEKVNIPTFNPSTTGGNNGSAMLSLATLRQSTDANSTSGVPVGPMAGIPARLARRILDLEFIEMCDLLPDSWQEETQQLLVLDSLHLTPRRVSRKAPVHDIGLWIECFSRMAAVLVSRYPDKAPELFAYQATIVRASRNVEGNSWVAYDRQYRREALANRDLNWSQMNTRLYNEAFTGRAKSIPRCRHCLSDTHTTTNCPLEPNLGGAVSTQPPVSSTIPSSSEVCRKYNTGRCTYTLCRYRHVCQGCFYPHPWNQCPKNSSGSSNPPRERSPARKGNGRS